MIFLESAEKQCIRRGTPLESEIRLVQHCPAMSAIVELLLTIPTIKDFGLKY